MRENYQGKHSKPKNSYLSVRPAVCVSFAILLGATSISGTLRAEDTGATVIKQKVTQTILCARILEEDEEKKGETGFYDYDNSSNTYTYSEEEVCVEDFSEIVEETNQQPMVVYAEKRLFLDDMVSEAIEEQSKDFTKEEKMAIIMDKHQISEFEFWQIVSTAAHEGGEENYSECYDVLCTAYNRTLSQAWCWSCNQSTGKDGTLIIDQLRWPGQFSGFLPREAGYDREKYEGKPVEDATIDFLFTLERTHDYTCFNAPWYEGCPASAVQLHPECKGNKYFRKLTKDDLNDNAISLGIEFLEKTY